MTGTTIGTRLYTWLRGEAVGSDEFGNRYYRERGGGRVHDDSLRRERRWVMYEGEAEASKVPPEWHAWLHHTLSDPPPKGGPLKRPWQKPHLPNLTGTEGGTGFVSDQYDDQPIGGSGGIDDCVEPSLG